MTSSALTPRRFLDDDWSSDKQIDILGRKHGSGHGRVRVLFLVHHTPTLIRIIFTTAYIQKKAASGFRFHQQLLRSVYCSARTRFLLWSDWIFCQKARKRAEQPRWKLYSFSIESMTSQEQFTKKQRQDFGRFVGWHMGRVSNLNLLQGMRFCFHLVSSYLLVDRI